MADQTPEEKAEAAAIAAAKSDSKAKGKPTNDPADRFIMQRVTNNTGGLRSINTQNGVQMLEAGAFGEAMIHENEGTVAPVIEGLTFEKL